VVDLLLVYLLVWATIVVFLGAGTRWLQNAIYSEPAAGLYWRAPVAGTVLALFLALWAWLDFRAPGRYTTLFLFSPNEEKEFGELRAVVKKDGKEREVSYSLRRTPRGLPEYREVAPPYRRLASHPEAIIVKENGQDVRFDAERDANQKFKIEQGQSLHYIDSQGRVMSEDTVGRLSTFRWSYFLPNILLNLGHFLLWFVCLWVLLRFQWSHALGLAVIFWIVMTILIVPMLLTTVEGMASPGAAAASARVG
jgi:hypothetical protein